MQPLSASDLVDLTEYESQRDEFRRAIIDLKRRRRLPLGELLSFVFENRETMRFQVQEMLRAEHITEAEAIEEELATYNGILPGPGELSATMFIEIQKQEQVREELQRFIGIDEGECVYFAIAGQKVVGEFEAGRSEADKISSVHYVRFPFTLEQQELFLSDERAVHLVVEVGDYAASYELQLDNRKALAEDFTTAVDHQVIGN